MKLVSVIGMAVLGCLLAGCDAKSIKDPPLTITFRQGVLSKNVMQVSNLATDEGIEVYVYVASADTSARSGNTVIPANGAKEFGALELKWEFKAGDKGFVRPVKYGKKLFFKLMENNQYKTWFGYDDIPEVDVAAQVRAQKEAEHAAWLLKKTTEIKADGMHLYVAITNANAKRIASGLASVWPKPQGSLKERAKDKLKDWKNKVAVKLGKAENVTPVSEDIATRKFKSSVEYFECLFDVGRVGTEKFSPYVNDVQLSIVLDSEAKNGNPSADTVRWSVLADYTNDMSDSIPVLISANFPCDKLLSFWDGKDAADEVVALATVGELKNEAFVVIYGDGTAKSFSPDKATVANIYRGAFNTCTNGYNRPLQYLTPVDVVNAVGVEK